MAKKQCQQPVFDLIYAEWCNLDITNKFLLLIGLVLLMELILSIFLHATNLDTVTDTFFRLSLSSVLGYFLGGINTGSNSSEAITETAPDNQTLDSPVDTEHQSFQETAYIRTIFIALVCLVCIVTLAIVTFSTHSGYEEGLIQLRNIISTTLGFLISKANRRS